MSEFIGVTKFKPVGWDWRPLRRTAQTERIAQFSVQTGEFGFQRELWRGSSDGLCIAER